MNIKERYKLNKSAKVGEQCVCPSCGAKFEKTTYQQAFCKTKLGTQCKDKYWNTVTHTKHNNTTRLSPANRSYYVRYVEPRSNTYYDDDQGWDGHKDSF